MLHIKCCRHHVLWSPVPLCWTVTPDTEVRVSGAAKQYAARNKHVAVQILLTTHRSDAIFGLAASSETLAVYSAVHEYPEEAESFVREETALQHLSNPGCVCAAAAAVSHRQTRVAALLPHSLCPPQSAKDACTQRHKHFICLTTASATAQPSVRMRLHSIGQHSCNRRGSLQE